MTPVDEQSSKDDASHMTTTPFVHLGLQLSLPLDWQNVSTLLLIGQSKDGPSDAVTVRILPADMSLIDAINTHSGASLDDAEVLSQEDVDLELGEGKRIDVQLKIAGEALVRTTVIVNREDKVGDRQLVVVSMTQSQAKYDAKQNEDLEQFLASLQWTE